MGTVAGFINRDQPESRTHIQDMLKVVSYRGNDFVDSKTESGGIAFGQSHSDTTPDSRYRSIHHRLQGTDYFVALDGRIDYRDEICEVLGLRNEPEVSDSFLLVKAYMAFGNRFVEKIQGDFAFSIWDSDKKKLILARDRMGNKNLFYYIRGNSIVWSSEIKQLFRLKEVPQRINSKYIQSFLLDNPHAEQETAYYEINRLKAGSLLLYENDQIEIHDYYQFTPKVFHQIDEKELNEQFLELLTTTIHNHLRSSGPVGVSLSGGLDSSSIYSIASMLGNENMKTYSYLFKENASEDESEYIEAVIDKYPSSHSFLNADEEWYFKGDINLIASYDEPYPFFNKSFATKIPNQMVEDNIKVSLNGMYGDEVLYANLFYLSGLLKQGRIIPLFKDMMRWRGEFPLWELIFHFMFKSKPRSEEFIAPWINKTCFDSTMLTKRLSSTYNHFEWNREDISEYYNFLIFRSGHEWTNQYITSSRGIDVRMPFRDARVMEFLAGIPIHMKINPGTSKVILRNSLKGILPEEVRTRNSKGSHLSVMLNGFKKEWNQIKEYYHCPILKGMGYIDEQLVMEEFKRYYGGFVSDFKHHSSLMRVLALEIWLSNKTHML